MAKLQVISRETHGSKRWLRSKDYRFTANDTVCPVVVQELPKAVLCLPVAFTSDGERFSIVAVQGLEPGKNLLLDSVGRWQAGYIPAAYRSYPFALANTQDNQQVLCIDEDSGLVTDDLTGKFFFETGGPSDSVKEIVEFLTAMQGNKISTRNICYLLQKYNLIQPWPIKVQRFAGEQNVEGLFRIDEAALNAVDATVLLELKEQGALLTAYCQLLSMQHLTWLSKLVTAAESQAKAMPKELNLDFLNNGDTISFGNL